MKFSQIITITWENITGNKMRSILTITGIAIGIATVIFLVSLGYGLQAFSVKRVSSIDAITTLDVSQGKNANFKLDKLSIEKILEIENVEQISPVLSLGGKASNADKKTDIVVTAVDPDFFRYDDVEIVEGKIFTNEEDGIIVSSVLAKILDFDNSSIIGENLNISVMVPGEDMTHSSKDLKIAVSGVVQDNSSSFIYLPVKALELDSDDSIIYTSLKVKVNNQENLAGVKKEIETVGFSVVSIADTINQISSVFGVVKIILAIFGGFALLVSAIGMFNTMTVALLERTRDIGIMKSIGVDNRDVYMMFLAEAIVIAVIGGAAGVGGGILISQLINGLIGWIANAVGAESVQLFYTPFWFALSVLGFSVIVGSSTGFYPAKRAARLNPLDALRYE